MAAHPRGHERQRSHRHTALTHPLAHRHETGRRVRGLAEYFEVDATPVRLLWAVLTIFPGAIICGVIAYAVAWLVIPLAAMQAAPTPPAPPDQTAEQAL